MDIPAGRSVERMVLLGDSTAVGLGDPARDGGWRGFGPLLAGALGAPCCANLAFTGARMRCVRDRQLPASLQLHPDVAVVVAGTAHHLVWLLVKGIPWLWYRGRDLLPHAASILLRDLAGGSARLPPAAGSIGVDDRATHWAPVRTR